MALLKYNDIVRVSQLYTRIIIDFDDFFLNCSN
jgi:hypothetical protein